MNLEIAKMLVLSTGHLTEDVCNNWMHEAPFAVYEKDDYGWFVYTLDDVDPDWPECLRACLDFAFCQGCGWIMFDRDGPQVEEIPYHEW